MNDQDLVERLVAHRTIGRAPREQLEWLAAHGTLKLIPAGEVLANTADQIRALFIVLSGHAAVRVDRGGGPRKVMEWWGGDVSGVLPYSRVQSAVGRVTVEEPSEILVVDRDHFREMAARCHELTAILVHVMLDRARHFTSSDLHDETLRSLGRLSAGLAHELNNPASALARTARELAARMFEMEAAALALGAVQLSAEQSAAITRARTEADDPTARAAMSPLERADREEAITAWAARHRLRGEIVDGLAATALTVEGLDRLAAALGEHALVFALHSIAAGQQTRQLAKEIEIAAGRIHSLVAAIKGFSHMDRANLSRPVAIGQGLSDTLAVLGGKARGKSVDVTLRIEEGLPEVQGFGGELNQVWANLIDNAIDAAPESGRVEVTAARQGESVVVSVVDNGPGVPAELGERIFEPFFTTKPMGQGTGLGLDIARRLVAQHDGQIEVDSRPGRTEFRVTLRRAGGSSGG
jgi:signal transduction histidine kinase